MQIRSGGSIGKRPKDTKLHEFHAEALFDPSMMVHFRKRFPVEEVAKINEYVCTGSAPYSQ